MDTAHSPIDLMNPDGKDGTPLSELVRNVTKSFRKSALFILKLIQKGIHLSMILII
jgi:hypothetical protein